MNFKFKIISFLLIFCIVLSSFSFPSFAGMNGPGTDPGYESIEADFLDSLAIASNDSYDLDTRAYHYRYAYRVFYRDGMHFSQSTMDSFCFYFGVNDINSRSSRGFNIDNYLCDAACVFSNLIYFLQYFIVYDSDEVNYMLDVIDDSGMNRSMSNELTIRMLWEAYVSSNYMLGLVFPSNIDNSPTWSEFLLIVDSTFSYDGSSWFIDNVNANVTNDDVLTDLYSSKKAFKDLSAEEKNQFIASYSLSSFESIFLFLFGYTCDLINCIEEYENDPSMTISELLSIRPYIDILTGGELNYLKTCYNPNIAGNSNPEYISLANSYNDLVSYASDLFHSQNFAIFYTRQSTYADINATGSSSNYFSAYYSGLYPYYSIAYVAYKPCIFNDGKVHCNSLLRVPILLDSEGNYLICYTNNYGAQGNKTYSVTYSADYIPYSIGLIDSTYHYVRYRYVYIENNEVYNVPSIYSDVPTHITYNSFTQSYTVTRDVETSLPLYCDVREGFDIPGSAIFPCSFVSPSLSKISKYSNSDRVSSVPSSSSFSHYSAPIVNPKPLPDPYTDDDFTDYDPDDDPDPIPDVSDGEIIPVKQASLYDVDYETSAVYSGESISIFNSIKAKHGYPVFSVDGSSFTSTLPSVTEKGKYSIVYKAKGTGDYIDSAEQSFTFTVTDGEGNTDDDDSSIVQWLKKIYNKLCSIYNEVAAGFLAVIALLTVDSVDDSDDSDSVSLPSFIIILICFALLLQILLKCVVFLFKILMYISTIFGVPSTSAILPEWFVYGLNIFKGNQGLENGQALIIPGINISLFTLFVILFEIAFIGSVILVVRKLIRHIQFPHM